MRIHWSVSGLIVAASAALVATAVPAQDREQKERERPRDANVDVDIGARGVHVKIGADDQPIGHVFRAGEIAGMEIRNAGGKKLGKVDDLVLHFDAAHIRYAALSFGGFLGLGDKLFAVPLSAMGLDHDAEQDKSFLVFDVTEEKLKETPGFDKNNWPDTADPKWAEEIDKFYGVTVNDRKFGVTIEKGTREGEQAEDAERDKEQPKQEEVDTEVTKETGRIVRSGKLMGIDVRNSANEQVGKIHDLVVDVGAARVTHIVLARGGVLGIGKTLIAVPHQAVTLQVDENNDELYVLLPVSMERMKDAPHFGDAWPDLNDAEWSHEFDSFFAPRQAAVPGEAEQLE